MDVMLVCGGVCTCVGVLYTSRSGHLVSGSITLCLILRQGLSLNLELAWQPARPSDHPVSAATHRLQASLAVPVFLCGVGGLEVKSSWLYNKSSDHSAISLPSTQQLTKPKRKLPLSREG